MKQFRKKPVDERVVMEVNRIYRVGYLILTFGILIDIIWQIASAPMGESAVRPLELTVLVVANIVCLLMMVQKGLSDDGAYAEAEKFPKKHYVLLGLGAGAAAAAVLVGIRVLTFDWEYPISTMALVLGIYFLSVMFICAAGIYCLQYVMFRTAKRRRNQQLRDEDEK